MGNLEAHNFMGFLVLAMMIYSSEGSRINLLIC